MGHARAAGGVPRMMEWLSDNGLLLGLAVLDGLASAAAIFMVAVGLNLVFGVLRILNVAHGSLYAIGAYTAASLTAAMVAAGLPAWLSYPMLVIAAALVGVILGPLIERVLLKRVETQEPVLQLLVTFALFMILEDVQKLIWGVQPVSNETPMQLLGTVDVPFGADVIPFTAYQLFVLPGIALLTLVGLAWFMRRTLTGRVIVAVTTDREAATSQGIDAAKVTMLTFTFGAALAALGGALASPMTSMVPGIGASTIVLSFAVVATAGLGQIEGAALAAVMIGLGRSIAVYLEPELEVVIPYLIMVLVLLVRPQGLFGVTETRRI
ncbi:branched-chain amino acid ABC transporter permease [Teichococcus aestuarii]